MPNTKIRHYYYQPLNIAVDTRFKNSGPRWMQLILSEDDRVLATLTVGSFDRDAISTRRVHRNEKFVFVRFPVGMSYLLIEGLAPKLLVPAREVRWNYVALGVLRNCFSVRLLGARISTAARLFSKGRYREIWRRLTRQPLVEPNPHAIAGRGPVPGKPRVEQGPIRAAVFSHSLAREGAPISLLELTATLSKKSVIDPVVFAPADGPLAGEYTRRGIALEIHPFPLDRLFSKSEFQRARDDLVQKLLARDIQFVLANTLRQFYAISAARIAGIPSLWIVRETEPWRGYFDFLPAEVVPEALAGFDMASKIVFVSNATRGNWAPLSTRNNSLVIPNALDPARFNRDDASELGAAFRRNWGVDDEAILLLNVGRVCALKGQADIVRAMAMLDVDVSQRLRIAFVGDCDAAYRQAMETKFNPETRHLLERIIWAGPMEAPQAAYHAADIYICSSRTESYPRAILEALCAGLAIVTTPVNGIAEQVVEGESALFYDPGDHAVLARRIAKLVQSPSARTDLSRGAKRAHDALPTFDTLTDRYANAIRELFAD